MDLSDNYVRGMAWWSSLSDTDRAFWLSNAHGNSPASAWLAYCDNQLAFMQLVHAHHERYPDDLRDAFDCPVTIREWPTS